VTKKYHDLRLNRLKRFLSSSEKICLKKNFRLFYDFGILTSLKEKLSLKKRFVSPNSRKIGMRNIRNVS
jgi:hypothetical protein